MKLKFTIIAVFIGLFSFAQTSFKLPLGYKIATGNYNKKMTVVGDFDGDMINDYLCYLHNPKAGNYTKVYILGVFLSTRNTKGMFAYMPMGENPIAIEYKKGVINLLTGYDLEANTKFTLKYYENINDFRLIGFDSFTQEYHKSIDLLKNLMSIQKGKTKNWYNTKLPKITSISFNENTVEMLDSYGL